MPMSTQKRFAFFLPNIFTALNLASGFGSILLSVQGRAFEAALILILGAIFDSVDGRVARLTGTQSSFGEQFDSMSDLVSFGIAPAFMMYMQFFSDQGRLGAVVAFIYLLCGALRLARFNANIEKVSSDFFQGLPIPGAALAVIGYVFLTDSHPQVAEIPFLSMAYTVFFSILMVTNIPFTSFKNSGWVKEHKKAVLFMIFILAASIFVYYKIMLSVILSAYVILSILYFIKNKGKFDDIFQWKSEND